MPVAVTQEQRDTLHRAARARFASVGMIGDHFQLGEIEQAKTRRRQSEDVFRLLDDLDWDENTGRRQGWPLTMPAGQLERTLRHLRGEAEAALAELPPQFRISREWASGEEDEDRSLALMHDVADHFLDVRSTCDAVLGALEAAQRGRAQ